MPTTTTRRLALEDGSVWTGRPFGALIDGVRTSEIVFNTAMTGYQESLTDPSYRGQTLVSTAPIVGIYGINDEDGESPSVQVSGFIVHELSRRVSNHRATTDLSSYLETAGVPIPLPEPVDRRLASSLDRFQVGLKLLAAFLWDGGIRGLESDGTVYDHRVPAPLCGRFREGLTDG